MSKLKLFGERVAVKETEEEFESEIALVGKKNLHYVLGEIHAISEKGLETGAAVGDVVLFQMPMNYQTGRPMSQQYKHENEMLFIQHSRDIIAKLAGKKIITLDTFVPIGNWVLIRCERIKQASGLVLPDNLRESPDFFRYYVLKKGSKVGETIPIGAEVAVDPNRLNPIGIDGQNYFYCDDGQVSGVIQPD